MAKMAGSTRNIAAAYNSMYAKKELAESSYHNAEEHMKIIDHIASKHAGTEGHHVNKLNFEIERVHDAHKSVTALHDAHAVIHRSNGNHEAAAAHEDAAVNHHDWAKVSTRAHGKITHRTNLDSHEEYDHGSGRANDESREAFKKHPLK